MAGGIHQQLTMKAILRNYGGWSKLWRSSYFRLAFGVTAATWGTWTKENWWEIVINVSPDLLGFTLSAFALLLAFGDEKFRELIAANDAEGPGLLEELSSTFLIFIVVQTTGLIAAFVCRGMWDSGALLLSSQVVKFLKLGAPILWGLCFFVFCYGTLLTVACARWIYLLAIVYSRDLNRRK